METSMICIIIGIGIADYMRSQRSPLIGSIAQYGHDSARMTALSLREIGLSTHRAAKLCPLRL